MTNKYGATATGFVRPSLQDILEATNAEQRALISEGLDQSPGSPLGQINAVMARQVANGWDALEAIHNSTDPDQAQDWMLTALSKLTGTFRGAATRSTVVALCSLTSGTTLVAGESYARVLGKPLVRFTPRETFTAPTTGSHPVLFEAEIPGPVEAGSNQLSVIATTTIGWTNVTNPDAATPGRVQEDDESLRARREEQLSITGNGTAAALKADLLALRYEGVQWIKSVEVFENTDNLPDVDGRPPHSFEVLVLDDEAERPLDADNEIAQVIWRNTPIGILAWGQGSESGEAIGDKGETVTVSFSRGTLVPIYIAMTLTTAPGFTAQAQVKDTIVKQARAAYARAGTDVVALYVRSLAFRVPGVIDVPVFTIGTAPAPVGATNIAIGIRQVATFSTANIDLGS